MKGSDSGQVLHLVGTMQEITPGLLEVARWHCVKTMKLTRTASRAKNGLVNTVDLAGAEYEISHQGDNVFLDVIAHDVPEFGNTKTHYDYRISVSLKDLVDLVEAAASASDREKNQVRNVVGEHLGKLIKLINICSE